MSNNQIHIIKASGETDPFVEQKLRNSLKNAGAKDNIVENIVNVIKGMLYEGITSKEIYKKAFALLKENTDSTAARYKLKNAIMEMGPTGYPFEVFVGELLKNQGYNVEVGTIVEGHCVHHEVDVVADKDHQRFMVECKFHNDHGRTCDVKIPLYIQSRFKDIETAWKNNPKHDNKFHQGWIFTNTRFTEDAIQYAQCMGLQLVAWDYPEKGNLKDRIDLSGLHPITSLTSLTNNEKKKLLEFDQVLCKNIIHAPKYLKNIGISETRSRKILKEAKELCRS